MIANHTAKSAAWTTILGNRQSFSPSPQPSPLGSLGSLGRGSRLPPSIDGVLCSLSRGFLSKIGNRIEVSEELDLVLFLVLIVCENGKPGKVSLTRLESKTPLREIRLKPGQQGLSDSNLERNRQQAVRASLEQTFRHLPVQKVSSEK